MAICPECGTPVGERPAWDLKSCDGCWRLQQQLWAITEQHRRWRWIDSFEVWLNEALYLYWWAFVIAFAAGAVGLVLLVLWIVGVL